MIKSNLEKKYALTILLITLLGLLFLVSLQAWQFNRSALELQEQSQVSLKLETERLRQERGESMADNLAYNIAEPFLARNMVVMYELILPVRQSTGVVNVFLFDPDGKILHDGTRDIMDYGEDLAGRYPTLDLSRAEPYIVNQDTSIVVVRPVTTPERTIGSILVELSTEEGTAHLQAMHDQLTEISGQSMRRNLSALGFASIAMVVLAAFFALLAGRRLAQPIQLLADHAERIGSGNYQQSLVIERSDEIGELAMAFDKMRVNLRDQTRRIEHQAYYDALTGLPNRIAFHKILSRVLVDSRPSQKHMLLYVDLDGFKRVNDGLGHGAGDRMLVALTQRLTDWADAVAAEGLAASRCEVARWGGDQFVVLLCDVMDGKYAKENITDLLGRLSSPCQVGGIELVVSASAGYSVFPADAKDSDSLISFADLAMYKSKERGKNLVSGYSPTLRSDVKSSLTLETEVRSALAEGQFEIMYRPSVDATSRAVNYIDTSIVWNHPERGALEARTYIKAIHATGLLNRLREWGFNQGLDSLRQWHASGSRNLRMTFNLARFDMDPTWFAERVADGLERTEIDSRDIIFTISEDALSQNLVRMAELLQDLRSYNFTWWLDSFGVAYTSLNRLRKIAISGIKLDHSLIQSLTGSEESRNMVSASIAMAHGFGIQAAADGVASEGQLDFLRRKGCDFVQGDLISQSLHFHEMGAFLKEASPGSQLGWSKPANRRSNN